MGNVFSEKGADRRMLTLERKNVQRILFVPIFLAAFSLLCVFFLNSSDTYLFSGKLLIAMTFYAVVSVAFSCFALQLLKKKSRKSELWLFQMSYMIVNTCFLTYISFAFWQDTGTLTVYFTAALLCACSLLYSTGEYVMCAGIECILPLALYLEGCLKPQQMLFIGAIHLLCAAVAYELGRSYKKAEEYRNRYIQEYRTAEIDPLTGVNNRRGMMRRITSVWPVLEQDRRRVAVMVLDIDYFKKYNDRFGHPAGDACLCRVAETICKTVKGTPALVSRIGGEEFLVFVYGLSEDGAYALAEQVRKAVEELGIPHSEEARYRYVTISVGVAADRCNGEVSFGGLYRRADKELYRAKSMGRNRVGFSGSVGSTGMERKVNVR